MSGFIEGENSHQSALFPESIDEYVAEDNSVRVVDVFVDSLDLSQHGVRDDRESLGPTSLSP